VTVRSVAAGTDVAGSLDIHSLFDLAAAGVAGCVTVACVPWRLRDAATKIERAGAGYCVALLVGAALGGYCLGTANLWLSGERQTARSIVGALAGAIVAVEIVKQARGIRGSTGLIYVPGLAASMAVGRWGCFFSGLADHTHGIPTTLSWGHDFGDGIPRHPVQLYESAAMAAFLAYTFVMLAKRDRFFMANGFYILVMWYAAQRFAWEFLKPYRPLLGPLNLFHLVCLGLFIYGVAMIRQRGAAPGTPTGRDVG